MKIAIHLWLFADEQVLVLVPPPVHGRLDVPSITDLRKSHLGIAGLDFFILVDISGTRIKTVRSKFTVCVPRQDGPLDRKSTRLNSSHVKISYAVFCL